MKRYPLPINSGEEAKLLEYVGKTNVLTTCIYTCGLLCFLIGDKVAKMLDKKISEFLDNGGKIFP